MTVMADVVRVFTDERGEFGNELGIVESSTATRGHEQQLAAELGFSETVFIDDIKDARATIQIFTPAGELPFAGHPSVGIAWWFARNNREVTVLGEKAGDVAIRRDGDTTWISGRAEWAPNFRFLPFGTPAEVDALEPEEFTSGMNYAYSWLNATAGSLRARMFGPEHKIPEDEATGAAAVAATTHLGRDLDVHQGRGSRIRTIRHDNGVVEVGGRTVWDRQIELF